MASTVQQKGADQAATLTGDIDLDAPATAGNLLILVGKDGDGTSAITLPSGFNHVPNSPHAPVSGRQIFVAAKVAVGGEDVLQWSSGSAVAKQTRLYEVNGVGTDDMLGIGTSNQNNVNTKTLTSTGTLARQPGFAVAVADQATNNGGETSVDEGFTLRDTALHILWMIADKIFTATTELSPTFVWATNRASMGFTAVFFEPTAPAGPTADAGTDQVDIDPFETVNLSGSGSGGTAPLTYAWTQTAGTTVSLTGATTQTPSFDAPATVSGDTLTFELEVTDDATLTDTDTVSVTVIGHNHFYRDGGAWVGIQPFNRDGGAWV
jgi:hypothetical protein